VVFNLLARNEGDLRARRTAGVAALEMLLVATCRIG
jgi:hypothetical protein